VGVRDGETTEDREFTIVGISARARGRLGLGALAAAGAVTLALAGPAAAHHSFAMFDNDHQIKLTGDVAKFTWQNPHVYIELDALTPEGAGKHWTIECANPGILNRVGWKWNMVKPGDKITVIVAPLRTGEPGALLKQITLPDGRKFSNGAPAGPALIQ
jgi:hypothetical protein